MENIKINAKPSSCSSIAQLLDYRLFEPRHEKTCLRDLRPGKAQTGLLSYGD